MVKLPKWLSGKSDAWAAVAPERVRPLSDSAPCGLPLEFDNDFAVLQTRLRPRGDVQYGDFVQASAGPVCWRVAEAIQDLCKSQMAADAPSLAPLVNLLAQVLPSDAEPTPAPAPAQAAPRPNPEDTPMPKKEKGPAQLPPAPPPEDLGELSQAEQRAQMLQAIHTVRRWLEENEPSSPVAILLKQAERLWGRRFAEVAQAIPIELLTQWDQQE
ncbi:MAG: hypothetical protein C4K60_14300 [Ideonella sp. MAG2]|nr:MAG: hypothetical protein C4K60_14300 [Ideonella sp. MAG2]